MPTTYIPCDGQEDCRVPLEVSHEERIEEAQPTTDESEQARVPPTIKVATDATADGDQGAPQDFSSWPLPMNIGDTKCEERVAQALATGVVAHNIVESGSKQDHLEDLAAKLADEQPMPECSQGCPLLQAALLSQLHEEVPESRKRKRMTPARARSLPQSPKRAKTDDTPADPDHFLEWLMSRYNASAGEKAVRNMRANAESGSLPLPYRLASACSGTEIWTDCHEVLFSDIEDSTMHPAKTKLEFVCDSDGVVQEYLKRKDEVIRDDACVFEKAEDLGRERAKCCRHSREDGCLVPACHGFAFGFSCKWLSRANKDHCQAKGNVSSGNENCSQVTYQSSMSYIGIHRPAMCLLENVETLDEAAAPDQAANEKDALDLWKAKPGATNLDIGR